MLEPYRESHVEGFVVRWVRVTCRNPECTAGLHRHGMVSLDGGPWVTGLSLAGDERSEEDVEPVLIETVGEAVRFSLDDGEIMEFDRVELLSALGTVIAGDMGRLRAA